MQLPGRQGLSCHGEEGVCGLAGPTLEPQGRGSNELHIPGLTVTACGTPGPVLTGSSVQPTFPVHRLPAMCVGGKVSLRGSPCGWVIAAPGRMSGGRG